MKNPADGFRFSAPERGKRVTQPTVIVPLGWTPGLSYLLIAIQRMRCQLDFFTYAKNLLRG